MVKSELSESKIQEFNQFFSVYEQQKSVRDEGFKIVLGSKDNKQCRFCGRVAPNVNFKKRAHVIPQLTGNRNIVSRFECDRCNEDIFSDYESSLAAFVGVIRTFEGIRGQKGVNKYKDHKTSLRIEWMNGMVTFSERVNETASQIKSDEENKQVTIRTIRDSYYPIKVYKSLLKIAYCLLDEGELNNFKFIHRLLMSDELDERRLPFIRLFWYFLTNGVSFKKSWAELFTRRPNLDNPFFPEKTLVIGFANLTYQIFLLSDRDVDLAKAGQAFTCMRFPVPTNKFQFYNTDLSSPDKKVGEGTDYTFSFKQMITTNHTSENNEV
jgi:hypothetical protein